MSTSNCSVSVCRHCQFYKVEGRRGGHCHQLGVQVQSGWKACSLAIPPFAPSWEALEGIMVWQDGNLRVSAVIPVEYGVNEREENVLLAEEI